MYIHMPTRTITITVEAYERLKAKKDSKESFSDVILKVTGKGKLSDFAGMLMEKEGAALELTVKESRARSRARAEAVRKRLRA